MNVSQLFCCCCSWHLMLWVYKYNCFLFHFFNNYISQIWRDKNRLGCKKSWKPLKAILYWDFFFSSLNHLLAAYSDVFLSKLSQKHPVVFYPRHYTICNYAVFSVFPGYIYFALLLCKWVDVCMCDASPVCVDFVLLESRDLWNLCAHGGGSSMLAPACIVSHV